MPLRYWLYAVIPIAFIILEARAASEFMEGVNLLLLKLATPAFVAWAINVMLTLRESKTENVFGKVFVSLLWFLLILMPFDLPY